MPAESMHQPSTSACSILPIQQPGRVTARSHLLAQQVEQSLVLSLRDHIPASHMLGVQRWRRPLPDIGLIVFWEVLFLLLGSCGCCLSRSSSSLLRIDVDGRLLSCICCVAVICLQAMQL